jgi:hypothetical protein
MPAPFDACSWVLRVILRGVERVVRGALVRTCWEPPATLSKLVVTDEASRHTHGYEVSMLRQLRLYLCHNSSVHRGAGRGALVRMVYIGTTSLVCICTAYALRMVYIGTTSLVYICISSLHA